VRGSPADFGAWAANGNPGWAFEDVLPVFRRIEADAEFGADPWHGDVGPLPITRYPDLPRSAVHAAALEAFAGLGIEPLEDHNRPGALGFGPMPMSSRGGARVTTADAYLSTNGWPGNLRIQSDSQVDRLTQDGARVTGVRLVEGVEIAADRVILAAGAFGSPAILLRSGIGPADQLTGLGITVAVDLPGVGANLADHPGVDLDSGWRGGGASGPLLHSIATFRSAGARSPAPDMLFWATDPGGDETRFYFDPILLKPVARGSVRLRSTDPGDPPRIRLPDVREPADLERLADGYALGIELANRPEFRRLSAGEPPADPGTPDARRRAVVANGYSIPHYVGTCRMGPSAAAGDVVDALGRVHGISGLNVVDASVIPDSPSGFPHLIAIMVAEHLVARWTD
jgi:choline dehydrogenase